MLSQFMKQRHNAATIKPFEYLKKCRSAQNLKNIIQCLKMPRMIKNLSVISQKLEWMNQVNLPGEMIPLGGGGGLDTKIAFSAYFLAAQRRSSEGNLWCCSSIWLLKTSAGVEERSSHYQNVIHANGLESCLGVLHSTPLPLPRIAWGRWGMGSQSQIGQSKTNPRQTGIQTHTMKKYKMPSQGNQSQNISKQKWT